MLPPFFRLRSAHPRFQWPSPQKHNFLAVRLLFSAFVEPFGLCECLKNGTDGTPWRDVAVPMLPPRSDAWAMNHAAYESTEGLLVDRWSRLILFNRPVVFAIATPRIRGTVPAIFETASENGSTSSRRHRVFGNARVGGSRRSGRAVQCRCSRFPRRRGSARLG